MHNSISLTVFSHSAFNVLKFRFRDPFISSPLRLSQFVRGLGARGVTYNFIYTCRLRKLIILTTLSDMLPYSGDKIILKNVTRLFDNF